VKIRLGIIGTGIAAHQLHLPALRELSDKYEIAVVCSRNEERASAYAKLVGGVPYVLDYRDVLKRSDVDAVDIMLPIELNYQVARDALKAGKHVVVEKPLATSLADARRLVALAEASPKVAMLAENFRYRPAYLMAKSIVDSGQIGEPRSVVVIVAALMDENNEYAQTTWRIHHKYPGGFVTDAGVHQIGALRTIFGDIESGFGYTQQINPALGEMDTAHMVFRTRRGVDISLQMSFSVHGHSEDRLLIMGTRGSMAVNPDRIGVLPDGGELKYYPTPKSMGYREEFEDFHLAVSTGSKPLSSFLEGYKDLEVILKAVQASQQGRPFRIAAD